MAENKRPTIVDVAKAAGVSISTTSNALSGVRRVRPETRRRVLKVADQLGYEPNLIARSLVGKRSSLVGILMPDITDNFLTTFVRDVERAVATQGLGLMIGDSGNDSKREERYLRAFHDRRMEGLLIIPTATTDLGQVTAIAKEIPTVLVDREISGWTGDFVSCDHRVGAEMLVDHLVSLGHTRIAQLAGDRDLSSARARYAATRVRLSGHGLVGVAEGFSRFTTEDAKEQAAEILRGAADFTALIAGDDLLALAVVGGAHRAGISVPGDLSVAGFDDIPFAELAWPALTTIRQPVERIAAEATRLLLESAAGPGRHVLLQPELIVRDSTVAPRGPAHPTHT